MKNYYNILGVSETATQDEIKKAYRQLSKQYHPDVNPKGEEKFKEVAEAYEGIGDENKRREYDNKKNNPFNSFNPFNPFNGKNNFDVDEDYIKRIFNNIHSNLNLNNDEEWERKDFTDPNGKEDFSSFSRSGFYNPFDGTVRFNEKQQEMGTLELLDVKLKESIMNEDYENSAKIRDLINSLKED